MLLAASVLFVVGYAAIFWFLKCICRNRFALFVACRVILGVVIAALVTAGVLALIAGVVG
ncbi:hypothetical protein ACWDFL_31825 [Streptomyces bungoensis]